MMIKAYPFREYVTVYKRSSDAAYDFAQIYFPLSNMLNRASVTFNAIVKNMGVNTVAFKLQSGVNDTSISTTDTFADISGEAYTVVGGGEVYIELTLTGGRNALRFVLTSLTETDPKITGGQLMITGAASGDPIFLTTKEKDYKREDDYGLSHWDTSTSVSITSLDSGNWSEV
jgi:hypothetical protein